MKKGKLKFWTVFLTMAPLTVFNQIAPVVAAALIGAGVTLVGNMMSEKAKREEKRKQMLFEGMQQSFQSQQAAEQNKVVGSQNAFGQLMQGYKSSFLE